MSLITRKRPRGFSENLDKTKQNDDQNKALHLDLSDTTSLSSNSTYNEMNSPLNFSNSTSTSCSYDNDKKLKHDYNLKYLKPKLKFPNYLDVIVIDEDEDEEEDISFDNDINNQSNNHNNLYKNHNILNNINNKHNNNNNSNNINNGFSNIDNNGYNVDEDDDLVILEEREILPKSKRNNSDSLLFLDYDSYTAYNMFNVNQEEVNENLNVIIKKKQRTNSLPQLPQVRCFYHKLPNNYILQTPKISNIKTNIIPHQSNLPPCDDEHGHYIIKINETFANRFITIKLLGQGTFGKVVQCFDKVNRQHVAIKIIRNIQKYRDAAKIELRILSTLKKFDNENLNHCIHLRECFDYRGHICIVTDLLKISLYDFLENNKFIAFPGSHIQAISKQLIRSVTFLHDLNLIHTDLKPENILLHEDSFIKKPITSSTLISAYVHLSNVNSSSSSNYLKTDDNKSSIKIPKFSKILQEPLIQIIDFGSAIFNDEYHSSIVSTRHYRAPEIVLGIGWSFPCDCWSIGCILVELVIGEPLFKTHDNLEHLAMIEKVCGYQIDKSMVKLSKQKQNECGLEYFTKEIKNKRYFDLSLADNNGNNGQNEYNVEDEEDDENEDEEDEEDITDTDDFDFDDDDEAIFDDESVSNNSLTLKFPTSTTPEKYIKSVNELERIDIFISNRIGLDINLDYSLSTNYQKNKHIMNFGNFTFWWFFIDLLKKLLVINPKHRLTAEEALNHPWFNLGIEDEGTMS